MDVYDGLQVGVESVTKYDSASEELFVHAVSKNGILTRQAYHQDIKKSGAKDREKRAYMEID